MVNEIKNGLRNFYVTKETDYGR